MDEERELSTAYRTTRLVRRPEGQGLNDLYVRFFRMAERRITEKTGQGVVCFISNYSWLDGLSFTGMRERFLREFDAIRIDSLNGDKYRTGKVAPDGSPDPSIFSTPGDPVGIQVGTAITTLVRRAEHAPAETVGFRNLWGQSKREELTETSESKPDALYDEISPALPLGLPFAPIAVSSDWHEWPTLLELFPVSFTGGQTKRDMFLIETDLGHLRVRINDYFDSELSHEEVGRRFPSAMRSSSGFVVTDARSVRNSLLERGGPVKGGFIRYAYRPFDTRWLYWETGQGLLGRPVPTYKHHVFDGNIWLITPRKQRREWSPPSFASIMADYSYMDGATSSIPLFLRDEGLGVKGDGIQRRPNLSAAAQHYLERIGADVKELFHHVLAVLHDPEYREANAGALRME